MKRAKLMLAAIAVLAIVGGVYASKAKRGSDIYCSVAATTTATLTKTNFTITPNAPGILSYCTDVYAAPATTRTLVTPQV